MSWTHRVRRWHRWLSVVIGVQLLFWTVSGFLFAWEPIKVVRGEAFLRSIPAPTVPADGGFVSAGAVAARIPDASTLRLEWLREGWVWVAADAEGAALAFTDARSGEPLGLLEAAQAAGIAEQRFSDLPVDQQEDPPADHRDAPVVSTTFIEAAEGEYRGGDLPAWRVTFADDRNTNVYIHALSGEVTKVRSDAWRRFDFLWMLHIMDYDERSDFSHPLLKIAAGMGVLTSVTGLWLAGLVLWPRKGRGSAGAALLLGACLLTAGCASPAAGAPPNIVLVFTDDQGWADIGLQGAVGFETPNIDRLASEGVRFTDFYVAQPVCSASRAALLTGCYPNRIGITGALGPSNRNGIHDDETTLGELCREAGYATAAFGKWHLGHHPRFLPTRHGFDEYAGIPYSNDMWPFHPESPKAWPPLPLFEGEEVVAVNPDQGRFTGDFAARAVDFIERATADERPFFVYLAHPMPHVPLFTSPEFEGSSAQGAYGDVIQEIDASVGRLMDALDRTGQRENTLFVFTSDNGPWLSYGDHAGSTGPLREGKGTTFEGGVRVPFVARWPARIPAGSVCSEPAMTIDVYPTVAGLLDVSLEREGQRPIDGLDILPLLTGEAGATSPHEVLYFYYHKNDLQALRAGRWKLHFPHGYRTMRGRELGSGGIPGKYDYGAKTGLELYDLETDIGEQVDLSASRPEVVERLVALADRMRADLGDKLTDAEGSGRREPGWVPEP